jgi:hypothetical protein
MVRHSTLTRSLRASFAPAGLVTWSPASHACDGQSTVVLPDLRGKEAVLPDDVSVTGI